MKKVAVSTSSARPKRLASSSAFAQNPPPPKPDAPTTKADEVELPGVDVQGRRELDYKAIQSDNYKLPDLL